MVKTTTVKMKLGKNTKNKLGIQVPKQCKNCGDVWKNVTKQGNKIVKITCVGCGKKQPKASV